MTSLRAIIDSVASSADDFLADCSTQAEARAAIAQRLQKEHPGLSGAERTQVCAGVLAILVEEGFFEADGRAALGMEAEGEGASEEG